MPSVRRIRPWLQKPPVSARINSANPLSQGLLAGWPFNENSGSTVANFARYGTIINGTLAGGTSWGSGPTGSVLAFDGSSGYVGVATGTTLSSLSALSISAWINTAATPASTLQMIVARYDSSLAFPANGYYLSIFDATGTGVAQARIVVQDGTTSNGIQGLTTISPGRWYHIVGTWNHQGTMTVFVNGIVDNSVSSAVTGATPSNSTPVYVGGRYSGSTPEKYWNGSIDFPLIWNRALSASEVAALYARPYHLFQPMQGAWLMPGVGAGFGGWQPWYQGDQINEMYG